MLKDIEIETKNIITKLLTLEKDELIENLNPMLDYFNSKAKEFGFNGISFGYQHVYLHQIDNKWIAIVDGHTHI